MKKAAKSSTKKQSKTPVASAESTQASGEGVARPLATVEPPYSCKLMWVKGVVRVIVNLQRVSDKCINFTPTSDRFYLDTFKHTKKYKLDFAYPHGVKVDASAPEATLEQGILKTDLRVVDWAEATKQHAEIVSAHQSMLKSRGIKAADEKEDKKAVQEAKPNGQSKPEPKQSSKKKVASKGKNISQAPPTQAPAESKKEDTVTKPKKVTKPKGKNMSQAPPTQTSESKEEEAVAKPKKKKRFVEKSEMNEILGQVVEAVETKADQRLHQDEAESSHIEEILQAKKEKQENRKKRKLEARALLQQSIKRKKNKNKAEATGGTGGKKVMFSS